MALYEVEKSITITSPEDEINIGVTHAGAIGTESYHIIDIPKNDTFYDHEWANEGAATIGRGAQFMGKHVVLYSKAVPLDNEVDTIPLNYNVNGTVIYEHNPAVADLSPSIVLTIHFTA